MCRQGKTLVEAGEPGMSLGLGSQAFEKGLYAFIMYPILNMKFLGVDGMFSSWILSLHSILSSV